MKIVALVLAGGEGTRLYPLTAEHSKPALPFANGYRIVDFVLSNLVNSKISTIYVLAQYKPDSLMRHIAASWAPWLNAPGSVIKVLLPRSNRQLFRGTADAVHQCLEVLHAHSPDVVAIFAADHVYRMDVRQMIDFHCAREADVSVAAVGVPAPAVAPFALYNCTRPVPAGVVNSELSMPIFRSTHSSESTLPVTMAISGMSPSV